MSGSGGVGSTFYSLLATLLLRSTCLLLQTTCYRNLPLQQVFGHRHFAAGDCRSADRGLGWSRVGVGVGWGGARLGGVGRGGVK